MPIITNIWKINEHSREDINNAGVDGEEKVDEMWLGVEH